MSFHHQKRNSRDPGYNDDDVDFETLLQWKCLIVTELMTGYILRNFVVVGPSVFYVLTQMI